MKLKVDVPVLAHVGSWLWQQSHKNETKSSDTVLQEVGQSRVLKNSNILMYFLKNKQMKLQNRPHPVMKTSTDPLDESS